MNKNLSYNDFKNYALSKVTADEYDLIIEGGAYDDEEWIDDLVSSYPSDELDEAVKQVAESIASSFLDALYDNVKYGNENTFLNLDFKFYENIQSILKKLMS